MYYKGLINFQIIFKRDDFNHISNPNIIEAIKQVISFCLISPDKREKEHAAQLSVYIQYLTSFYNWIEGRNIPDIHHGYTVIVEVLKRCIWLFSLPEPKRTTISRGYAKKFSKTFQYGLARMLSGIRAAFDPDLVGHTRIERDQLIRYIFDNKEGLGRGFLFNMLGRFAFVKRVSQLPIQEIEVTERLLIRPSGNQIRRINGWLDLGVSGCPVRVLAVPSTFGRDRVYFLFRANEHPAYQAHLQLSPKSVPFRSFN
ncbi:hypothetical protein DRJ48_04025 [Candidatus Woesearchaeota archaeon]|nr:hypothetical protein [Candidatus Woesearchaeota archaeon]RLE42201.1 MAG: hypothetical protein DRJ48_04025 [Candidatus Woesearchaeota archaeon]